MRGPQRTKRSHGIAHSEKQRRRKQGAAGLFEARAAGNAKTATIKSLVEKERAKTGSQPSAPWVASMLAMSLDRVLFHFRILGFEP